MKKLVILLSIASTSIACQAPRSKAQNMELPLRQLIRAECKMTNLQMNVVGASIQASYDLNGCNRNDRNIIKAKVKQSIMATASNTSSHTVYVSAR